METRVSLQPAHTCPNQGQRLLRSYFQTSGALLCKSSGTNPLRKQLARTHDLRRRGRHRLWEGQMAVAAEGFLAEESASLGFLKCDPQGPWGMPVLTTGNTGVRQTKVHRLVLALYLHNLGSLIWVLKNGYWKVNVVNGFGMRRPKSDSPTLEFVICVNLSRTFPISEPQFSAL